MSSHSPRRIASALLFPFAAVLAPVAADAQGATLSGRVTSETGEPLLGANVTIDALAISVGTNAEGRYTITLPAARVRDQAVMLRARAIGFAPQARSVSLTAGAQTFDFSLKVDINRLNQVVVTGVTGATEVKKLPFTVAQVSEKDMPVPGANPLAQIQGKVPGANIVSASGRPGSTPAIILRGPQSINAAGRGQDPLVIVDGAILNGTLADINPQDIENVEVVKGAAASSLYGSRAGNGVIQITTRSGKNSSEGVRFNTRVEYGFSDIEREYQYPQTHNMLMNETMDRFCIVVSGQPACSRTVDIGQETFRINDQGGDFSLPPVNFTNDGGISLNPCGTSVDRPFSGCRALYQTNRFPETYNPIQQFLTDGETWNGTFDMTGRIARTNFFASANQFRQEGSVRFIDGYQRNSLRLNVDQQLGQDLNVSVRTFYSNAEDFNTGAGESWFRLTRQPANATLLRRDSKGRLFVRTVPQSQGAQNTNPAYGTEQFQPVNNIDRFTGSLTARWGPLSWLDGEMQFGYDYRANFQDSQEDRGYRTTAPGPRNLGFVARSSNLFNALNFSTNATARRDWLDGALATRLNLRVLYEQQDDKGHNLSGDNLAVPGLADANAAIQNFAIGSYNESVRQLGMFAALDLEYKERYILGTLFRRDGSSLFGEANRWQNYGRGSVAWRVSEEPWFGVDQVSDLKLRYSIGQAGNRPRFSAQYETFTIGAGGTLNPQQLGNRDLRPEVSTEIEYGLDLEVLNRYGLTLTYADNRIDGQILPVPPPAIAGFATQWRNVGELHNQTVEASLNVPVITGRDLSYSFRVLYDRTRSTISRLDVPEFFTGNFKIAQGLPFGEIFGRRFITGCGELPTAFRDQCGPGRAFQRNSDGFVVWVGDGNTPQDGITKNLWFAQLPGASAPWGAALSWGMPIKLRDSTGAIPFVAHGNALPRFRWALSQNFAWKRLTAYALVDAVVGKYVYNQVRQWSLGDLMHRTTDQAGKSVAVAKPVGYYFRASPAEGSSGIGGLYDILGPNNLSTEDAGFVKVREFTVGYRLGRLPGVGGTWNLSVIGRNLRTWTGYSDFDPEVGTTGGTVNSAVLNAVDAGTFPNLRTWTFQLGTSF
jgi:TonB-linked SusC/RagA family outer membrane protein